MICIDPIECDFYQEGIAASARYIEAVQPWLPMLAAAAAAIMLVMVAMDVGLGRARAIPGFLIALLVWAMVAPQSGEKGKERTSLFISKSAEVVNAIGQGPLKAVAPDFYDPAQILPFRRLAEAEFSARLDSDTEKPLRAFLIPECFPGDVTGPLESFAIYSVPQAEAGLADAFSRQETKMTNCKNLYTTAQTKFTSWAANQPQDAVYQAGRFSLLKLLSEYQPREIGATVAVPPLAPPESKLCERCLAIVNPASWGTVIGFFTKWWLLAAPLSFILAIPRGGIFNLVIYFRGLLIVQLAVWPLWGLHVLDKTYLARAPTTGQTLDLLSIMKVSVYWANATHAKYLAWHNQALYIQTGLTILIVIALVALFVWQVILPIKGLFQGNRA